MTLKFQCDACGETFEDRLDHAEDCQGPFPASWWSESDGDVLWWCWDGDSWISEAPYVGSPMDYGHTVEIRTSDAPDNPTSLPVGGWPGYHTHWTRIATPRAPVH